MCRHTLGVCHCVVVGLKILIHFSSPLKQEAGSPSLPNISCVRCIVQRMLYESSIEMEVVSPIWKSLAFFQ